MTETTDPYGTDPAVTFAELYGSEPDGTWAAPGRVNLIGEYTDFNDGFVMPLALPHTARAAVSRRDDGVLRLYSADVPGGVVSLRVDELAPHEGHGWAAYPAGVLWALREAGHPVTGADIALTSTVPTGAGLSSSAALEVVTALALNDLFHLGLTGPELAVVGRRAENDFVGVPCGIMDQMASACCVEGHALHLDTRDLSLRQVPFDLAAQGLTLLVVDTRVKHALGDGAYAERRAGCEEGARLLGIPTLRDLPYENLAAALTTLADAGADESVVRYVRHVVGDNRRVEQVIALLDAGDVRAAGPVLNEGHRSLRDDLRVSCPELDLVVEAANEAGALGARMTGGGFGGSAVVLVEEAAAGTVAKAVSEAFAAAGHAAPGIFDAIPSAGARRLR
ncbi:galactokinase [Streptomyces anulatus]|uniref:galactokinase n=1 Tax=Streptomyces anulatus TaxID=1892 RepID=UPI002259BE96|nr:galactokinase [Streptomyces anulatus]MCX4507706.1 galactokinase [Streptomyces anulatus]MCX4518859.1 galactokinase [Streptomyces anulatus]MCX4601740.1 galactokinase [Streptomyces anulatus]WTD10370.1 galactokinase [Streptomyces anulatus]WTD27531.1 galactokinase [Streptomyces anulatus]